MSECKCIPDRDGVNVFIGSCDIHRIKFDLTNEQERISNELKWTNMVLKMQQQIDTLEKKLEIFQTAAKESIREGSKCRCSGYDVNKHKGYGLSDDIVRPLEKAFEALAQLEDSGK